MATRSSGPSAERAASLGQTSWLTVFLAIAAGVLAAFQVGKVHIALPSVRQSFSLGLVSASLILSALSLVGLFVAAPIGTISSRIGNKRAVVIGLIAMSLSSAVGGFAPSLLLLLALRFIEGIGFVIVIVAAPSLIVEVTTPESVRLALGGWSAYMPGGIALIAFIAPHILAHHTWRAVWWFNAIVLLAAAIIIALSAKREVLQTSTEKLNPWEATGCVLAARGPLLLAIVFGMYTMQHLSVMGFMPTILQERFHLPQSQIGLLVAVAMASNILGNLAAGFLLQRGIARTRIISITSIFMACMTVGMFAAYLPLPWFYCCALAFSCIGGLVPSSIMGAAPFYTPSPALLGATNGILVQGSNLGIVIGPILMSFTATHFGWNWVPIMTGLAAISTAALAGNLRVSTVPNPSFDPVRLAD
jgi:DHA1 family inner membrane transport protein